MKNKKQKKKTNKQKTDNKQLQWNKYKKKKKKKKKKRKKYIGNQCNLMGRKASLSTKYYSKSVMHYLPRLS